MTHKFQTLTLNIADRVMETLLVDTIKVMQKKTGLRLVPTYSYCRLYRTGNISTKT